MQTGLCRDCGEEILFARLPNGRAYPLDPEPNVRGSRVLDADGYLGPGTGYPLDVCYVPHYVTCRANQ